MPLDVVPLEDEEQHTFVEWLEWNGLRFSSIPNSTYTTSWSQKHKNHYLGLRPGLCDLLVLIPPSRSVNGEGFCLFIEMKRRKGGVLSTEQKAWIDAINNLDSEHIAAYVCRGAPEAIEVVQEYLAVEVTQTELF